MAQRPSTIAPVREPHTTDSQGAAAATIRAGIVLGVASYVWWGLGSFYFKAIANEGVPATVTLCHRIVWSFLVLWLLVMTGGRRRELASVLRDSRTRLLLCASTLCITVNWLVFIFAVTTERLVESSLGYFINPLFTILLGMVFLRERLRPAQSVAVVIAACGVGTMTISRGLPWIAIALPISFGMYSLIRKQTRVGPIVGLFVETAMLAPVALAWAVWGHSRADAGVFTTPGTMGLLAVSGIVTTVPLVLFVAAAQRLPLTTMGFLQYINPTIQFLVAVLIFGEPFGHDRIIAFALIWGALAILIADTVRRAWGARLGAVKPGIPTGAELAESSVEKAPL